MGVALFCGMPVIPYRQRIGQEGEELACRELERRGYRILARRYRTRFGEIDIVCEQDQKIVFVEVKARATRAYGDASEQVTFQKQRRIAAMALDYLAYSGRLDDECRFDVVAIDEFGSPRMQVRVIEDAFPAHGR
jgi:putative endonuclease